MAHPSCVSFGRGSTRRRRIIIICGLFREEDREPFRAAGADRYLLKPALHELAWHEVKQAVTLRRGGRRLPWNWSKKSAKASLRVERRSGKKTLTRAQQAAATALDLQILHRESCRWREQVLYAILPLFVDREPERVLGEEQSTLVGLVHIVLGQPCFQNRHAQILHLVSLFDYL
jgi:CheY-like chemotaxis protein